MYLSDLFQYLLTGLAIGSLYALVGLSFNIIYNATGIINFAQGEFVMLGALSTISFYQWTHSLVWGIFLGMIVCGLVGFLVCTFILRGQRREEETSVFQKVMLTIGLSIMIKGVAILVWGKGIYTLPNFLQGNFFEIKGLGINEQFIFIWGLLLILGSSLWVFFHQTLFGKSFLALFDNKEGAKIMGIGVNKMIVIAFVISAMMSALIGAFMAPLALVDYQMGVSLSVKGFAAAIIGGLGSFPGAIFGGLFIGVLESGSVGLIDSSYKDMISILILIFCLFFFPSGIFKGKVARFS